MTLYARADEVCGLRENGMTYAAIGTVIGCSGERVRQIVSKHIRKGLYVPKSPTKAEEQWRRACLRIQARQRECGND
jgi:hypothetical protein